LRGLFLVVGLHGVGDVGVVRYEGVGIIGIILYGGLFNRRK
jgi:hypothetical protein